MVASTLKLILMRIVANDKETSDVIKRVCNYLDAHLDEDARRAHAEQTAQLEETDSFVRDRFNEQDRANLINQAELMDMMLQLNTEPTDQILAALEQVELNLDD
ncbi:Hypothetical Protein FCC1311_115652, partial [Hondaea fermentalgiana]